MINYSKHLTDLIKRRRRVHVKKQANARQGVAISLQHLIALRGQAEQLLLSTSNKVINFQSGNHLSHFRGRGIDFEEVRIYQPGDDIRHMDWRVTARTGKPHTKLYREERERPVYIVVDYNPSMFFATRVAYKSVIAAQAAALFGWAAVKQGDRVGGFIFSGNHHIELAPRTRQFGVLPLLKALANQPIPFENTANERTFANSLAQLRRRIKPGSLVILLSDFHYLNEEGKKHLSNLTQYNELLVGLIADPLEITPPPPDRYAISNGEEIMMMDTRNKQFCEAYRNSFLHRVEALKHLFAQKRVPFFQLHTDQNVTETLLRILRNKD